MAFSFGASSTPSFSFGGGAASAPSLFGGASTGTVSLFGATAAASTTTTVSTSSTPAFSFSSGGGLFGGPTSAPAFGVSPTPSLFGGGGGGGGGQAQAGISNVGVNQQLVTKENRPITHSTKWEELGPQAQQYLLELEKVITTSREECLQLDGEERLKNISQSRQSEFEEKARLLSQNLATLGVRVASDREEAEVVRRAVSKLLRHTETAVYTYKKTHAWREAARTAPGQPLPSHLIEQLGGPVALPSPFLLETVASLKDSIATQEKTAAEVEANLQITDKLELSGGAPPLDASDPSALISSLQASIANIYDCLMRAASRLQYLDDRIASLKTAKLVELQRSGSFRDPFLEAEQHAKQHAVALDTRVRPKSSTPGVSEPSPIRQSVATPVGLSPSSPLSTASPIQTRVVFQPTGIFGTATTPLPQQPLVSPSQQGTRLFQSPLNAWPGTSSRK